jgi:hypothetical protein
MDPAADDKENCLCPHVLKTTMMMSSGYKFLLLFFFNNHVAVVLLLAFGFLFILYIFSLLLFKCLS